jgi:hypothetical protein
MPEPSVGAGPLRNRPNDDNEPFIEEQEGLLSHEDEVSIPPETETSTFTGQDDGPDSSQMRSRIRIRQRWGLIPTFELGHGEFMRPRRSSKTYLSLCLNCFFFSFAAM